VNDTAAIDGARDRLADHELRFIEHQIRAMESSLEVWDKFVSFDHDELTDDAGREVWSRIGLAAPGSVAAAYTSEAGLDSVRGYCRWLATHNEFALNGHENRISYIVGKGHQYRVEAKPGEEPSEDLIDVVRQWLDEWIRANRWHRRQQEIRLRMDRDGEAFLRFFATQDGLLRVRFIEPEKIKTPDDGHMKPRIRYGIEFDEDDAETPLRYFLAGGESIEAAEVQHRKANVDLASPRGLPLFYAVRKNLKRAEKLLANLSHLAGGRAAIAWIEKHVRATHAQVQSYLDGQADVSVTSAKGEQTNYERLRPGTVKHVANDTEYEWPPAPEFAGYVVALQAELRAVASRLVMPEFMLSSDASNANYSSTMVAEGPAVKMFEREQAATIVEDQVLLDLAIQHAVASGLLPAEAAEIIDIVAEPPNVQTRNRLQDAQADQILSAGGVLSRQTWAARNGLDYSAEVENMEEEDERSTGFAVPPAMAPDELHAPEDDADDGGET